MAAQQISLGMIVRNEGRTLDMCLSSVAPYVHEIVIGLGGESTDDTEQIARKYTNKIIPIEWHEDFSEAREIVMAQCTGQYFMWIDGDDEVLNANLIPSMLASNPNVDGFYMGYDYARDENGNNTCYLIRERIVKFHPEAPNRGWVWLGKVHEVLVSREFEEIPLKVDEIVIRHHKPLGKHDPERNLKILYAELAASEPNPDPRVLSYIGNEISGRAPKEAIQHWQRFIKLSGWREERYQVQHKIADTYRALGEYDKALLADYDAIRLAPDWPDAYFGLAETYYIMDEHKAAVEMTKAASTKTPPQTMLIINPRDYDYNPLMVLALAYTKLNDFEMALANYEKAYKIKPHPLTAEQIRNLKREIDLHKTVDAFLTLRTHLGRYDEWIKVRNLYNSVPKLISQHPTIQETWQRTMRQTSHLVNPEAMKQYYTHNEEWTPVPEDYLTNPRSFDNSPGWGGFNGRMAFALKIAKDIKAKKVVDLGCADGMFSLLLAQNGFPSVGFDMDPNCLAVAKERAEKYNLPAKFVEADVMEIGGVDGEKADLALAFELIEHLVNPEDFLRRVELLANHVALTTPYLAYDEGNPPSWDKDDFRGHVRIFDLYDVEAMLTPRGRINNLYRVPQGESGWIFADYEVNEPSGPSVTIAAFSSPEPLDPTKMAKEGMGGSELAVVKLAENLVKMPGNPRVYVYSKNENPGYYDKVCYRPEDHWRPEIATDLFIAWRAPEAAEWGVRAKKRILWLHDMDYGDRLTAVRAQAFHKIVVLSEWHKQHMLATYPFLDPEQLVIIGNGVDPSRFNTPVKRHPKRVIYSSSPDRGLDVILEGIWPKITQAVPDAELHVYYGMNVFDKYADRFEYLKIWKEKINGLFLANKNVVQHGRVNQEQLAEEFKKGAIWLYPTYFWETYCITAIEVQLAGVIPVFNRIAALQETVASGFAIPGDVRDPKIQEEYAKAVIQILTMDREKRQAIHKEVKASVRYQTWEQVAREWYSNFLQGGTN